MKIRSKDKVQVNGKNNQRALDTDALTVTHNTPMPSRA